MEKRPLSLANRECIFCPNHELGWHYIDVGDGPLLILLHGIGMSHVAWRNVIDNLANKRRVLAFDIAGFGITPPLANNVQPIPANFVTGIGSLADTLSRIDDERKISEEYDCVDIAGNSLGGFLSLEAARIGKVGPFRVRSIAAISPAGLWKKRYPLRSELVLQITR